jgi:hypothetical protein
MASGELTKAQRELLMVADGRTIHEVERLLGKPASAISAIRSRLVRAGLLGYQRWAGPMTVHDAGRAALKARGS